MSPKVPSHEPPRISQTTVIVVPTTTASRAFFRQYQARRRPITSSSRNCWLSAPKRLGQGISLRKSRSAKPRNTITAPTVAASDHSVLQPLYSLNQTKSAGLVSTATRVAARVRRRHWSASSVETAACGRTNPASGCSAVDHQREYWDAHGSVRVTGELSAFVLHRAWTEGANERPANAATTTLATA